jgi:hypothetical protein
MLQLKFKKYTESGSLEYGTSKIRNGENMQKALTISYFYLGVVDLQVRTCYGSSLRPCSDYSQVKEAHAAPI